MLTLLPRGKEQFAAPIKSPRIQQMRHVRFEKKRQELLEAVRKARQSLIAELETGRTSTRLSRMVSVPSFHSKEAFVQSQCSEGAAAHPSTNRDYQEEIVKKAKEGELKLLNKMLSVEEHKNLKYEENEEQRAAMEEQSREQERQRKLVVRKRMEEKMRQELESQRAKKIEERQKKQEAQMRAQEELMEQEMEQENLRTIERQRISAAAEHEKRRKEKVDKVMKQREQEQFQQEVKLRMMEEKSLERERLANLQKQEQQRNAERQTRQFEMVKERVQLNLETDCRRKLAEYVSRQQKKEAQERSTRIRQRRFIRALREKAEQKDLKIRRIVEGSKKIMEQRKAAMLAKQQTVEQRLRELQRRQKEEKELRKEETEIKKEIKQMNAERKQRKDEYRLNQIRQQLTFEEMRKASFIRERDNFKSMRLANQTEAAFQRQRIRTALQSMAIWNVWDMSVVKDIIISPSKLKDTSIEELVRRRVAAKAKSCASLSGVNTRRTGKGRFENRSTFTVAQNDNVTASDAAFQPGSTKNESQTLANAKKRNSSVAGGEKEDEYDADFD